MSNTQQTYISEKVKNASWAQINPATEEKQDTSIALLEELKALNTSIKDLVREQARFASLRPSELPYAKSSSDAMRVVVDSGTVYHAYSQFGKDNTVPTSMYLSSWTPNAYDAREMLKYNAGVIAELRMQKWNIS